MSYKSYQKASSRPFDHLYDQNFLCNPSQLNRLNAQALLKTAPLHIIPCYHLMFSDQQRNFCLPQINPLPIEPPVDRNKSKCACFMNKNLLCNVPLNYEPNYQEIKLAEEVPVVKTFRSVKCQTKYRESEAQTDSYLPDAKLRDGENCVPEIACIKITTLPSRKDIEIIERARYRRNWENNLSQASMEEKIRQLKIIEWENFLMHEKEMNDLQLERLQQVFDILDERMTATRMINEEILQNTNCRYAFEVKERKRKLHEKLQRKLRRMAKFHGQIEEEEVKIIKNFEFRAHAPSYCAVTTEKSTSINFELPKSKEGKWREIFDGIRNRDQINKCKTKFNCVEEKEIKENTSRSSNYIIDDQNQQNVILIQTILKGRANQVGIVRQMNLKLSEILKYRAMFPIKCLEGIVPKLIFEPPKVVVERKEVKFEKLPTVKVVDKIVDNTIEKARQIQNQNLLREAEKMRKIRREIEERHEKIAERKQKQSDEIKSKLKELYDEMTTEIIEKITPVAIELIAQQDAQKFIIKKAKEIDRSTKMSATDSEIDEEVEKMFEDILIPHVMKIISKKDEEMLALIASHDAFDELLKIMCEQENKEQKN